MMMLIPEAWENHETMSQAKKDFYQYHACLMEPWDGPATVGFTDGRTVGAVLDRNGLRPSRYYVTKDDIVIMASEVGVLDIPVENIVRKGRLEPGKIFLVDMEQGRIVDDDELKHAIASAKPYGKWLNDNLVRSPIFPRHLTFPNPITTRCFIASKRSATPWKTSNTSSRRWETTARRRSARWGPTRPWRLVRSSEPLFHYFKQLFAQVTNPPLDAIREELVTSVLHRDRRGRKPPRSQTGELPSDRPRHADPRQRRTRSSQAARRLERVQVRRLADDLQGERRREGYGRGA